MKLKPHSHIHFMGICGTAMASLAGILHSQGHKITGSDQNVYPPMSTQLQSLGIVIQEGYKAENLTPAPDLVIVGNVIPASNPEAQALMNSKIPYLSLPKALGELVIDSRHSIVVAGTHGKTTTTSMMAWVAAAQVSGVGYLIGGIPKNFEQSFQSPSGDWFVIEGDEYDTAFFDKVPKFNHYRPRSVIFTSLEFDHADIYKDFAAVEAAFLKLMTLIPTDGVLVYCADDERVEKVAKTFAGRKIGYGLTRGEIRAENIRYDETSTLFDVTGQGRFQVSPFGPYQMKAYGTHNLLNALSVIALSAHLGWDKEKTQLALKTFDGVKRRQEILGTPGGVRVIEDFAHHPTAVKVTLEAIRSRFEKGRLHAVFEPRSATSRRNIFQKDYANAFGAATHTYIAEPFDQAKIVEADRFSSQLLVDDLNQKGQGAELCHSPEEIITHISNGVEPGDTIVVMSNGGFGGIYQKLLASLSQR